MGATMMIMFRSKPVEICLITKKIYNPDTDTFLAPIFSMRFGLTTYSTKNGLRSLKPYGRINKDKT
jgi:hypothetical protein